MKQWLNIGNGVLLLLAWLYMLSVLYIGLVAGLSPLLAGVAVVFWTLGILATFRASLHGSAVWRKVLPVLVSVLSVVYCNWSADQFRAQWIQQHGPPRRYYVQD